MSFEKGYIPWNKKKRLLIKCKCGCGEFRLNYNINGKQMLYINGHANKGRIFPNLKHNKQYKSGHIPHNKGIIGYTNRGSFITGHKSLLIRHTPESKQRMSIIQKKVSKYRKQYKGESHWNWKGGISLNDKKERYKFHETMQERIFIRDNYTCQICDQHGGKLHVDHIKSWAKYPELRFDPNNCRTLCMACHYYITFKKSIPAGLIWGHNLCKAKVGLAS